MAGNSARDETFVSSGLSLTFLFFLNASSSFPDAHIVLQKTPSASKQLPFAPTPPYNHPSRSSSIGPKYSPFIALFPLKCPEPTRHLFAVEPLLSTRSFQFFQRHRSFLCHCQYSSEFLDSRSIIYSTLRRLVFRPILPFGFNTPDLIYSQHLVHVHRGFRLSYREVVYQYYT